MVRYSSDSEPGYTRHKKGRGWGGERRVTDQGKEQREAVQLRRWIASLRSLSSG